ncbi:uncharacterized protein LOC127792244 [Diospyros lotus]|uniref:uncharacterized protein LOC127792244 n=1 Tax=Diospyros lotus TaxID=55363 RepID=UPI00225B2609|nr:uncharacterized protein LOC127792244 [Diospyros lotus]
MKKLYGKAKGKVHPSPPVIADRLSLLPATILTLAAALSPEDKQVLAYLISCSGACSSTSSGHRPQFHCNCFSCYMSYWVRWDSSPNRQLIHEILDAYEEGLFKKRLKAKKERGKRVCISPEGGEKGRAGEAETAEVGGEGEGGGQGGEVGVEKGPVRKLVSFIGERIWGVWGI